MSRPTSSVTAVNSAITEDVTAYNSTIATSRRPSDVTSSSTACERFDGLNNVDLHVRRAHATLGVGTWTDDHPKSDHNDEGFVAQESRSRVKLNLDSVDQGAYIIREVFSLSCSC